jgi:deazaflavin-dependent oxidoreductase (nitroreductase family)
MHLKRIDPPASLSPSKKVQYAFGRSRVGRWYGINEASSIDPYLHRISGGRMRSVGSMPTALLASTGAKSNEPRENPVLYFHDGNDVVLVASSFGRDKHPAWYHNLVAHPACSLNSVPFTAAEVTDPGETSRLYELAIRVYPGYADYRVRTAAIGRRIPVLRLTPAS